MDGTFTYVTLQNVLRFRDLLNSESDPTRLGQLRRLLIEEEDRLGAATERLDDIEREIAQGEKRIERQRALVASMERDGRDVTVARAILQNLIQTQAVYSEYRQKLLAAIDRNRV